MVLLISYDLNRHERPASYADVKRMIESSVGFHKKVLHSQWLVDTLESIEVWHERMGQVTDEDDRWLIVRLTPQHSGWLDNDAVEWSRGRVL